MTRFLQFLTLLCGLHATASFATTESYAKDPRATEFAHSMTERHGMPSDLVLRWLEDIRPNAKVLQLIRPPVSPTQRSWERYRPRFLNERRIERGVRFWTEHADLLRRASRETGVPESVIVAIIGVETEYGRNTGGFRVLEALATLAFDYPPRADFFRTELEQFLLLCRENQLDPRLVKGSYAGAIGIPQFMPGSQRRYAVDFDQDQKIDLSNSTADAIGSVARFLEQHGWQRDEPIAFPAQPTEGLASVWQEAGIRPTLPADELLAKGVHSTVPSQARVALIELESPGTTSEYWLGLENFYVITRYNRSTFYAMAVFQLAEAIRARRP